MLKLRHMIKATSKFYWANKKKESTWLPNNFNMNNRIIQKDPIDWAIQILQLLSNKDWNIKEEVNIWEG